MAQGNFSKKIIQWYVQTHRDLPWREKKDPYQIWLSEIILQQTRVAQGLPYYEKFIREYPNIVALANAPEQKVLRTWQGLGYYSRARNLHACAKVVASQYRGKFPTSYDALLTLPGIGSYTAAAIASMAFGQPVAVVDGNVYRVLARIFGIDSDISSSAGQKEFKEKAQELLAVDQPGAFNQAVMEFGALHCTPKSPDCTTCIFRKECVANRGGLQSLLPVKRRKVKVRKRYFTYFIFAKGKKLALKKRNEKDIWSGLYDFYLVEDSRNRKSRNVMQSDPLLSQLDWDVHVISESEPVVHLLTHQRIYARFVFLSAQHGAHYDGLLKETPLKYYSAREAGTLPKPVLISNFLAQNGILE